MPFVFPPPKDLRAWIHGAVVLNSPTDLRRSCFPAQVSSMLVIRVSGSVWVESPGGGLQPLPSAALIAPSTRFTVYAQEGAVHAVGLVLRGACLSCLVQGSAAGLANQFIPLSDLPDPRMRLLVEAVYEAVDDQSRVNALFAGLREVLKHPRHDWHRQRLECLVQAVVQDLPGATRSLGLGVRQLQRQCLAGFGLTPKQLQSLARLSATLLSATGPAAHATGTDAELALDHGFFDQSHLGRDMRRLVGTSLSQLRRDSAQTGAAYWPVALGRQLM